MLPSWLGWWLAALASLVLLASYLDKSAALRGTHGHQPSWVADKLLRLIFFGVLVWPTLAPWPLLAIPYLAYLPSYLDGCVPPSPRALGFGVRRAVIPSPPSAAAVRVLPVPVHASACAVHACRRPSLLHTCVRAGVSAATAGRTSGSSSGRSGGGSSVASPLSSW